MVMGKLKIDTDSLLEAAGRYDELIKKDIHTIGEQAFVCCALLWFCVLASEKKGLGKADAVLLKILNDFRKSGSHKRLLVHWKN